jgi:hypothetical protein
MKDVVNAQELMREIIGEKLSSVVFGVFRHLGLAFDGPSLVAHNPVSLKTGERVLRFGEPGFCDALCGQLGLVVSDVQISDDELRIIFVDQSSFAMSLREADYVGPEAGMYYSADKGMMVF